MNWMKSALFFAAGAAAGFAIHKNRKEIEQLWLKASNEAVVLKEKAEKAIDSIKESAEELAGDVISKVKKDKNQANF